MEKLRNLRRFRKAKKLTQRELAECVGVSESAISQYENGGKIPSFEVALKIAETLDCETIDLVTTRTGIFDALDDSSIKKEPATIGDGQLSEYETAVLGLQPSNVLSYEFNMMALVAENSGIHNLTLLKALVDAKTLAKWKLTKASGTTFTYDAIAKIQYNADEQSAIEKFTIFHSLKSRITVTVPSIPAQ